jgi:hypothetical protein
MASSLGGVGDEQAGLAQEAIAAWVTLRFLCFAIAKNVSHLTEMSGYIGC